MKKVFTILSVGVFGLLSQSAMSQNVIVDGNMEAASADTWSVTTLNSNEANSSNYEFGSVAETPAGGVDANLQFSITNTGVEGAHLMFYQEVKLEGGSQYVADMAVQTVQDMNNSWIEVYLGEQPLDGFDYGTGQTFMGGFKWSEWADGCSDSFDAMLLSDGCIEGSGETITVEGEGEVIMYFGFKAGIWGAEATIELVVDEISLTKVETVAANEMESTSISVYPNPVNNTLSIQLDQEVQSATVFNRVGQELLQVNNRNDINVSDLAAGFYLVSIVDVDGKVATKKFQKN